MTENNEPTTIGFHQIVDDYKMSEALDVEYNDRGNGSRSVRLDTRRSGLPRENVVMSVREAREFHHQMGEMLGRIPPARSVLELGYGVRIELEERQAGPGVYVDIAIDGTTKAMFQMTSEDVGKLAEAFKHVLNP